MLKGIKVEINGQLPEVADLYLYGTVRKAYPWETEEDSFISADKVRKALNELQGKTINVHINSGGGDVFESIAISNLIRSYEKDINIYIDALAGSGASIIAAAGDKVYMFDNSMQMIHKAWTCVCGNSDELRKAATDMDKIDTAVKASYNTRFVGTAEDLDNLLKEETWLTAEDCLALGLADEIVETSEQEPAQNSIEPEPQMSIKETLTAKYGKTQEPETAVEESTPQATEPEQIETPVSQPLLERFKKGE